MSIENRVKELTRKYSLQVVDGCICSLQKPLMPIIDICFLQENKKEAIKYIISENRNNAFSPLNASYISTQQTIDKMREIDVQLTAIINRFQTN